MPLISRLIRRKVDMKSSSADTTTVEGKFFPWAREENFHFSRLLRFSFAFPPVLKINNFEHTHNSMPVLRRDVLRVVTFAFFSFLLASRSYTMYDNDNGFGKTTSRLLTDADIRSDPNRNTTDRTSLRAEPVRHNQTRLVRICRFLASMQAKQAQINKWAWSARSSCIIDAHRVI